MKKVGKAVLIVIVALVLLGAISSACSGKSSSSSQSAASPNAAIVALSSDSATASVPADSPGQASGSEVDTDPATFAGTWDMIKFNDGKNIYNEQDFKTLRKNGGDYYVALNEGGDGVFVAGTKAMPITWKVVDGSGIELSFDDDPRPIPLTMDGDRLIAASEVLVLKKGEPRESLPVAENASTGPASAESSAGAKQSDESSVWTDIPSSEAPAEASNDEVSPDLKDMLDSYEAFMDEYVEFMRNYKESDDLVSMMQEYGDYMQKYSEFMKTVDTVDEENLSAADYAYYIEVTSRVTKKLADVI